MIYGASYDLLAEDILVLLRNNPYVNNHITEILALWGANCDQKCITSYHQVIKYLLKYVMKPEKQSKHFEALSKAITNKIDQDTPLKSCCQKILMSCIAERDMGTNECFLICQNLPYVIFSKTPRYANLKGSFKVKTKINKESDTIADSDNWQESYWTRETIEGYQILCSDFENGTKKVFKDKHPKDISLREFMTNFTKKWKFSPAANRCFPSFIPTFKYIVNKKKPNYEEWCKNVLLQDKPGCYFDNAGVNFEKSCELELKDFVENSPFCPELLKDEFMKSQYEMEVTIVEENDFIPGDDLYVQPEKVPDNVPRDETMQVYAGEFGETTNIDPNPEGFDDDDDNRETFADINSDENIDWNEDVRLLNLTKEDLVGAKRWIQMAQSMGIDPKKIDYNKIDPEKLNTKQKLAYHYVISWINLKIANDSQDLVCPKRNRRLRPLYLNVCGRAGTGKSFFLLCIQKYLLSKGIKNFMKIGALTASAAFLVNGSTLHRLLKLPVNISKKKELPKMQGASLHALQKEFETVELLVIDEKSMIGQFLFYMIEARLRELKPNSGDEPFGGVSVIMMGDFAQLPPVKDFALFQPFSNATSTYQTKGGQLFKDHFMEPGNSIIFDQIMRQNGDDQKEFRETLDAISSGNLKREQWKKLEEHDLKGGNFSPDDKSAIYAKSTMVCALNRDKKKFNISKTQALGTPIARIRSQNRGGDNSATASPNKAGNLPIEILIAKGSAVMLTQNLWPEAGLTNGAKGIVKHIIYEPDTKPPKSLPLFVIVSFEQYIGPNYKGLEKCFPIIPDDKSWVEGSKTYHRTMLPLNMAYAISIHNSQGKSMENLIVNIGSNEFANGLTYTALTRVRKFDNLYFEPFYNFDRFDKDIRKQKMFIERIAHEKKEKESDDKFCDKLKTIDWYTDVAINPHGTD